MIRATRVKEVAGRRFPLNKPPATWFKIYCGVPGICYSLRVQPKISPSPLTLSIRTLKEWEQQARLIGVWPMVVGQTLARV